MKVFQIEITNRFGWATALLVGADTPGDARDEVKRDDDFVQLIGHEKTTTKKVRGLEYRGSRPKIIHKGGYYRKDD